MIRFSSYFLRKPPILSVPALMAPILCDSPCFTMTAIDVVGRGQIARKHSTSTCRRLTTDPVNKRPTNKFSVQKLNKVIQQFVSPLVDKGWFCQAEIEQWVRTHVATHTDYKALISEENLFQEDAFIPLMFGHFSAGLRQQCLRQLLVHTLFTEKSGKSVR